MDPKFDPSTRMRLVLVPADASVGSVIYRLRATDEEFDYPLQFELVGKCILFFLVSLSVRLDLFIFSLHFLKFQVFHRHQHFKLIRYHAQNIIRCVKRMWC
jgi:hypothetical protein